MSGPFESTVGKMPENRKRLRLLWINCRLLHPLNGGDRIRTYNMLKLLKQRHHIKYLSPKTPQDAPEAVTQATEFCDEVIAVPHNPPRRRSLRFIADVATNSFFGKVPLIAKKYWSPETVNHLRTIIGRQEVDLIVCDYLPPMINVLALGAKPPVPTLIFQHNVESLIWKRHVECSSNPLKKFVCKKEWELTHAFEETAAAFVDGQITVSEDEYQYFRNVRGMKNVLGAVPTGVDCDYYKPAQNPEPFTMAFLGSMDWHANLDAVDFFVRNIYPQIKAKHPKARFLIIGRNPPDHIRALTNSDPSIEVTGTVPDVRPYLARASIMVLPLRVGGGTRIKVFEAMAAGLAVVSTHVGAEGLPVKHDEHIMFADSATDFSDRVCELFENRQKLRDIANNSVQLVRAKFSWNAAVEIFEQHCFELLKQKGNN